MNKKIIYIIIFVVVAASLFVGGFALGLHNSKYDTKCKEVVDTQKEDNTDNTSNTNNTDIYSGSNDMEIDPNKIVIEKNSRYDTTLTNNIEIVKKLCYKVLSTV